MAWAALLAQTGMALSQGEAQSQALKAQGVVAGQQALADENAQRRENRQMAGEGAAALAENGLSSTGSSAMRFDQSRAMAELDALNIRYRGRLRALGLDTAAEDARSSGAMLAGQTLLKGAGDLYRPRSRGLIPQAQGSGASYSSVPASGFVGPR